MVMFPEEVVPYEWESIREAALEALGRGENWSRCIRSGWMTRTIPTPSSIV